MEHVPLADTVVLGQLDANNAAYESEQLRHLLIMPCQEKCWCGDSASAKIDDERCRYSFQWLYRVFIKSLLVFPRGDDACN